MRDLTVISEILNATDEGLSGADIYKALQDRMTAWRVYKTGVRRRQTPPAARCLPGHA